jgi:ketosteroid isomerase-like protein
MNRRTRSLGLAAVGAAAALVAVAPAVIDGADALRSLVDAERAFARMSVRSSQREAFLEYFADDGVWFVPAPANTKEALRKQVPTPGAPGRLLDWDPVTGDISSAGDLGYTTGPYVSSERLAGGRPGKTLATGWFFSIWRKQPTSGWRVAADFGIGASHARRLRTEAFRRADVHAGPAGAPRDPQALADELRAADLGFAGRVTAASWADALQAGATSDVRTYRDGHEPGVGPRAAASLLTRGPVPAEWKPAAAAASSSGELGFTYGAYREGSGPSVVRGYYLHVWKRLPSGWALAVDVANVEPPPTAAK